MVDSLAFSLSQNSHLQPEGECIDVSGHTTNLEQFSSGMRNANHCNHCVTIITTEGRKAMKTSAACTAVQGGGACRYCVHVWGGSSILTKLLIIFISFIWWENCGNMATFTSDFIVLWYLLFCFLLFTDIISEISSLLSAHLAGSIHHSLCPVWHVCRHDDI